MNYTLEQLDTLFYLMPEDYQDFIMDIDNRLAVEKIVADFGLNNERRFKKEVFALLIGAETPSEFAQSLRYSFNKDESETEDILVNLDDAILEDANDIISYYIDNEDQYFRDLLDFARQNGGQSQAKQP